MKARISFEEFQKRKRPEQTCIMCGKHKEIYTHLDGDEGKPLCNACNMKLRRESASAVQVRLLKLCAAAIGSVEAMLGLPVEEKQKRSLQDMQDRLKLMVRGWLGDPQADEEAGESAEVTQPAEPSASQATTNEFSEARKAAVSEESDKLFEATENDPSARKSRKARIASKVEQRKSAKAKSTGTPKSAEPGNSPSNDPAYQAYLEAPLA